ncbi:MAG: dihydroorotase [Proteobacteria bacterium]|nr:dihydroorotase [Pseudomonadota bacterium]MBU4295777.1 dihydroorotase [Pseudomonadota bacterium]MCG2747802.1 dihydroorotase [Desulfobulbaceae bacterium]
MNSSPALLLQNARIIDPANNIDEPGDLLIVGGTISQKGKALSISCPDNGLTIDLQGKWLVPGLIDMHVHLREPGEEYKETIASGTKSAAAGGFTAVACMPNTNPVNDNQSVTSLILTKAAAEGSARVYPVGAISKNSKGTELAEYGELKKAGAVAVSDDGRPVENSQLMRRALEYSGNHNLLVISHSEEASLSENGVMNEGALSTRLGLRGVPTVAESIMIYRDLALAKYVERPIHIAHISTRESVDLVRWAKSKGCKVTAETAPHYFSLTEEAVGIYNTRAKMNPPLRSADDLAAIREGLRDGTIDAIATDHAPHSAMEKDVEFDQAANGIIGLETAVPLTLALVRENILSPSRMIELLSTQPARILGVTGGSLAEGYTADITVIDPEKTFVYREEDIVSKSSNSPFLGWEFTGKAVLTIVGGKITYRDL